MNRREFFKILAGIIVAPTSLLIIKPKPPLIAKSKLRQIPWKHYFTTYHYANIEEQKLIKQFRKAFRETKFQKPITISS